MINTAEFLFEHVSLPSECSIINKIASYDAAETLGIEKKWPRIYDNFDDYCSICNEPLAVPSKRKLKSTDNKQLLISKVQFIMLNLNYQPFI